MSDLRELVGNAIADEWMKHTARNRRLPGSKQLGDAAIAAFAEAMLQPEVVEAAARALANISDYHLGFASGGIARLYEGDPDPWNLMSDEDVDGHGYDLPDGVGRNNFRFDARTALTAALAALGAAGDGIG